MGAIDTLLLLTILSTIEVATSAPTPDSQETDIATPRYITSATVVNKCTFPLKVTAFYTTFGNEVNPLRVVAAVQPNKSVGLPEQTKNQGTWTSVFSIPTIMFQSMGNPNDVPVTLNQDVYNITGVTTDYWFECIDDANGNMTIEHHP